jgi:hypothetical protein
MIEKMPKPPLRISSKLFTEAVLLVRIEQKKEFCEAIFLRGPDDVMEVRAFLDTYRDVDHFNLSASCISDDEIDARTSDLDPGVFAEKLAEFERMTIEIGEFYGEHSNLVEIASVTIRAHSGRTIVLKPDPDRWIADQFMIVR